MQALRLPWGSPCQPTVRGEAWGLDCVGGARHWHSYHWHSPGLPLSLMPTYEGDWEHHPWAGSLSTVTILGALQRKKLSSGGSQPSLPWKCFKHQALLKCSTSCLDTWAFSYTWLSPLFWQTYFLCLPLPRRGVCAERKERKKMQNTGQSRRNNFSDKCTKVRNQNSCRVRNYRD